MNLKERLQRMLQIVEDSERVGALTDIERDILLNELREAYTELKFGVEKEVPKVENEVAEEPAVAELLITPIAPSTPIEENVPEEADDEPEVEVELIFDDEDDDVEKEEESSEEKEEPAAELPITPIVPSTPIVAEEKVEPVAEPVESVAESAVAELPIAPTTPTTPTPKRSALLSLYEDAPTPVLGEQFHEAPSVADTIACPKGVAESTPVVSLHDAIGVADKFMIIRELFGGDTEAYEKALNALEAQPSFDDCIIYIAENYTWSPNSEATKLVMELLNRKYN
jgi:hypothetical protein